MVADPDDLLQALDRHRPELCAILRPVIESSAPEIFPAALAPDSVPPPRTMTLPREGDRDLAIVVLGCGRGVLARSVALAMRESDSSGVMLVVETDVHRFVATLLHDDWGDLLEDRRVRFAIGASPSASIPLAVPLPADPLLEFAVGGGMGLVPGDTPSHVGIVRSAFESAARNALARCEDLCARQTAARVTPSPRPSMPSGPWRVFSSVRGDTTALRHLAPSIVSAARRAGHEGLAHVADACDPFLSSRSLNQAMEIDLDLFLAFLRPGAKALPWRTDYPSLVLVSSNPRLLPIETFDWSERDLVVVTEPGFAPAYEALGLSPLVHRLGTEVPDLETLQAPDHDDRRVLVVGNIPSGASVAGSLPPDTGRRLIAFCGSPLFRDLAEDWGRHPSADVSEVIATTNITGDRDFMDGVALMLGYEATRIRRIGVVLELSKAGFEVHVHGGPAWEEALCGTKAEGSWRGWLQAGRTQNSAFHGYGVTVNVNSFATPGMINMRSFEVPAAAGVLVSDDRPALHEAFEVGTEVLAFQGLEDLPDLVGDILGDPDRRDAVAAAGRARVVEEHSWDGWWRWAESAIRNRFPPPSDP